MIVLVTGQHEISLRNLTLSQTPWRGLVGEGSSMSTQER